LNENGIIYRRIALCTLMMKSLRRTKIKCKIKNVFKAEVVKKAKH